MRGALTLQRWWKAGWQALDALVFPWECAVCGGPAPGSPFCVDCRGELLEGSRVAVCPRCAMPLGPWASTDGGCSECRGRSLGFDAAMAIGPYDGMLRSLCLRLKNECDAWLAPWLAGLLVEARPELRQLPEDAAVVPVPLHWRRHWERGYNQAESLARGLAHQLHRPFSRPLRRTLATPKLARAGRTERAERMRDAFETRRTANLEGRTILLVDDILTTGATCGAAARALKRAGARHVVVVVLGRAEGTLSR